MSRKETSRCASELPELKAESDKVSQDKEYLKTVHNNYNNYNYYNKYQQTDTELASTKMELQQQKDFAKAMTQEMGVMSDKNATPVSLAAMPDVADAAARIYWMKNTGEVYIDPSNLPEAPKGKQYQLWAIVDGKPVSGGMINVNLEVDGQKVHLQKMQSFGIAQAFAVSLEDAGPEKPVPSQVMVMGKM